MTEAENHLENPRDLFKSTEPPLIDFLETQLDLLGKLGDEKYAQLNASKMDEAE